MRYKITLLVGILLALLMALTFVRADDATPEPGTPADNECNPGGVLYREENQDGCPTEWYWKAGWYLAAVNNGRLSRDDVPDEFKSVLPPLPSLEEGPEDLPEPAVGTCWPGVGNILGFLYLGPANTLANFDIYMEGTCTSWTYSYTTYTGIIFAHSQSEAEAICATLGTPYLVESFTGRAPTMPSYAYLCAVNGPTA